MKRAFLLGCLLLILLAPQAAVRRALVIGIGAYPASGGWAKINGDKDVDVVEKMLLKNGWKSKDICRLRNEQATYSAICNEMEKMISIAQPGDFIYIHFSGHGQQITDRDGDEEDGYDEAWIPYDAPMQYRKGVYEGQHHITDDRLNGWLHRIRKRVGKQGQIVVVADACHSGDGTRGQDEEDDQWIVRGTSDNFVIPGPKSVQKHTDHPIEWVSISACKPYQCNYEYHGMGSLTYALSEVAGQLKTLTGRQLQQHIRTTVKNVIPRTQTPVMDMPEQQRENVIF